MINDQELREAVEILNNDTTRIQILSNFADSEYCGNALNTVLSFTQQYLTLSEKEGVPKERKGRFVVEAQDGGHWVMTDEAESYNQTRQEMLLAFMKMMPTEEEIKEKIHSGVIWNLGERYTHRPEFLSGITNEKEMLFANELAQSIHNLIMGRMR